MSAFINGIQKLPHDVKLFILFNLFANIGFGVFQLVFNLYLIELNFREDYIGAFNSVQTVFMALAGVTLGFTIGKLGLWHGLVFGMIIFFISSYAVALVEQPLALLALSATFGFGLCYLFNFTMPFILEFCPPADRPRVAAITFSMVSLAITVGSLVGGFMPKVIHDFKGDVGDPSVAAYRATLMIGTTIAALGLVPLMFMGEARRSRAAQDLAKALTDESPTERLQVRRDLSVFVGTAGLMSLGVGLVVPFYNVFLTTLGANSEQIGFVFAFGSLCAAIIGLLAPWVARRFGSLNSVLVLRLGMLPCYFLLIFFPIYGLAIVAHAVRLTCINMNWPIDSTFMGEMLPRRARATAFGWRSAAWNFGSAISALIGGWVIVKWGYNPTFVGMIVFTALSAIFFTAYFRRHPRVRSGELDKRTPRKQTETERVAV